ncbi:dialkylrecorsinol condensing enzyme DarA [Flavobacterium sp. GT3R68]|uniref:dialkylrecorsinol condensing enzyme DarA n=1 Tax=Flavobacterium sp. GT3R68 TaxID=2594437 RepID=UPI000F877218|nr:dialkylrecorsinol condensing enzyme DarA [Flavobacterium sp. GT3R68]RTY93919.1 dialkylresorcinol condensing enzyme DarA [Flavobacterium sp. GSN2]TRW93466.1 dialkylresorcinol condensing enzyme DarA [Flavobacterium sp. GT3R68]
MKNVLVLYYTQSGQLEEIAKNIANPILDDSDVTLTFCDIALEKPFPFPWKKEVFFDAFPESFLQIPTKIIAPSDEVLSKKYDLIIFAYQVWYLSPSIPANSFLKSEFAKQLMENVPVITVIGCRNMWIMAQEKVKQLLRDVKGNLVGNIVLVDRAPNLISVITIVDWMFTGVKRKYLGIFPKPGVSEKDIQEASRFGEIILGYLKKNDYSDLQSELVRKGAVNVSEYLIKTDKKGNMVFNKWASLIISKKESRAKWLKAFNVYLLLAIWVISPIVYILHIITYPFTSEKRKRAIAYYQSV